MSLRRMLDHLFGRSIDVTRAHMSAQDDAAADGSQRTDAGKPDDASRASSSQRGVSSDLSEPFKYALSWPARDLARSRRLPRPSETIPDAGDGRKEFEPPTDAPQDDATVVWRSTKTKEDKGR